MHLRGTRDSGRAVHLPAPGHKIPGGGAAGAGGLRLNRADGRREPEPEQEKACKLSGLDLVLKALGSPGRILQTCAPAGFLLERSVGTALDTGNDASRHGASQRMETVGSA